jgi:hypothetical protein
VDITINEAMFLPLANRPVLRGYAKCAATIGLDCNLPVST